MKRYSSTSVCCKAAVAMVAALVIAGCTRKVYVPVETVRIEHALDSTRASVRSLDSVLIHDSVCIERRGDTVYHSIIRNRYRVRMATDTLLLVRRDTVVRLQTVTAPLPHSSGSVASRRSWIVALLVAGVAGLILLLRRRPARSS